MSLNARTALPLTLLVWVVGAMAPPVAPAAVRLASPTSIDTAGDCLVTACRLDRALAAAQPGDEVALEDGVPYSISYEAKATNAVTIRPANPGTQPRLVGTAGLAFPTLRLGAGGTVTGLQIETAASQPALFLGGGARGVGLELFAGTGASATAAKLESFTTSTALINSVAKTASAYTAVEVVDPAVLANRGGASIVNVTAIATGASSWGVTTELYGQSPVLKNSIVRSTAKALHGRSGSMAILTSNTNFPFSGAANFTDGANNQKDVAVTFANQAGDDYRVPAGQPTIDAGAADALITATIDPDGNARSVGSAPDIGAFEYDPTPAPPASPADPGDGDGDAGTGGDTTGGDTTGGDTTGGDTTGGDTTGGDTTGGDTTNRGTTTGTTSAIAPETLTSYVAPDGTTVLAPAAAPVLGTAVTVDAGQGTPLVKLPGSTKYVPVTEATSIPVGSTIDATLGHIRLTSVRDDEGRTQTGEFWGGRFVVRQAKDKVAYTDLVLTGSSFAGCPKVAKPRARAATAFAAAASRKQKGAVVRSLWGRDHKGKFRTRGRNSVATVRGTVWLVQDRCDGTLTRVTKGAVDVRETSGTVVRLRAGRSHLAKRR